METAYQVLLEGVKRGAASWTHNVDIDSSDVPSEFQEVFKHGIDLAEERHWLTMSETPEDIEQSKAQYDSIAYFVNGWFGTNVVSSHAGSLNAPLVFTDPETGEKTQL